MMLSMVLGFCLSLSSANAAPRLEKQFGPLVESYLAEKLDAPDTDFWIAKNTSTTRAHLRKVFDLRRAILGFGLPSGAARVSKSRVDQILELIESAKVVAVAVETQDDHLIFHYLLIDPARSQPVQPLFGSGWIVPFSFLAGTDDLYSRLKALSIPDRKALFGQWDEWTKAQASFDTDCFLGLTKPSEADLAPVRILREILSDRSAIDVTRESFLEPPRPQSAPGTRPRATPPKSLDDDVPQMLTPEDPCDRELK